MGITACHVGISRGLHGNLKRQFHYDTKLLLHKNQRRRRKDYVWQSDEVFPGQGIWIRPRRGQGDILHPSLQSTRGAHSCNDKIQFFTICHMSVPPNEICIPHSGCKVYWIVMVLWLLGMGILCTLNIVISIYNIPMFRVYNKPIDQTTQRTLTNQQ